MMEYINNIVIISSFLWIQYLFNILFNENYYLRVQSTVVVIVMALLSEMAR